MNQQPDREFTLTYFLDGTAREHELLGTRQLVGRAKHCDLCFPFNNEISRLHATFSADEHGWTVEDMASRSGTCVNGERLTDPCRLKDRDVLTIGTISLTFRKKAYDTGTVDMQDVALPNPGAQPGEIAATAATPHTATPTEQNYYDLIGVPLFEKDVEVIARVGKERIRALRDGAVGADAKLLRTETGKVSDALVCLTNLKRKQAYDIQLAEQTGHMVEIHGDHVIPRNRMGVMGFFIGVLCVGAVVFLLWFVFQAFIDALAPILEQNFL